MTAHTKNMITVSIVNSRRSDGRPYRRNLFNLFYCLFCFIYSINQQIRFFFTIKVFQYIRLSYFYIMIIKHTDFYRLVISIQICFQLVGSMLLELINKIPFRLKHIFLIFCTLPEFRVAEDPLDFLCRPVQFDHGFQISRTDHNGICLRLIRHGI